MIKVGIVGGTGYTGVELLRLLAQHPQAQVEVITSRSEAGMRVDEMYPNLRGHYDSLAFSVPDVDTLGACDVVFFATPHGVAHALAGELRAAGTKVIDLSADFRLQDATEWGKWYGQPHGAPELLKDAVYGLPEVNREKIRQARLIAVPGCYPTATQLGFLPLLEAGLADTTQLIADCKSGVSGAGRGASVGSLYSETSESMKAYAVKGHRHLPEISQGLRLAALLISLYGGSQLLGPWLVGASPVVQDLRNTLAPPSAQHWLGTDVLGRSALARLAHAAQLSLGMALLAAVSAAVPGTLLGIVAAWRGGRTERALLMLSDSVLAIPGLLLVLLVAALAPGALWALYAGLSAALWVEYFRVSRAVARPVLAGDAVQASRLLGFGRGYVLRRHLLPALAPTLGTLLAFTTSQAVLALAALGFVGVGMQPPTPELGLMMTEAMPYYEEAPWLIAAPTALLVWLVAAMMLLNPDRETA